MNSIVEFKKLCDKIGLVREKRLSMDFGFKKPICRWVIIGWVLVRGGEMIGDWMEWEVDASYKGEIGGEVSKKNYEIDMLLGLEDWAMKE